MNIVVQMCGVALMLILLYFYSRSVKLKLYTERAFQRLMDITILSLILDITSNFCIANRDTMPILAVDAVCKLYLISLMTLALCGLSYVCADIYDEKKKVKKISSVLVVFYVGAAVSIGFLPISYHCVEELKELYSYGPSVLCTYFSCGVVLLTTIVLMKLEEKKLNPVRRRAMTVWMVIWLGAAIIQFLNNQLLLVGMASVLGCTVVYLLLENPESNRDRNTGLFNQNALKQYLNQLYIAEEKFAVASILLEMSESLEDGRIIDNVAREEMLMYLSSLEGTQAFTCAEDEVVLVFNPRDYFDEHIEKIEKRFHRGWGKNNVIIKPYFIHVPNSEVAPNKDNLLYYMRYVRYYIKKRGSRGSIVIDEALTSKIHKELQIEKNLAMALEKDKVEVFYQPIYSTKDKRFTSAEALVRIYDDKDKMIMPNDFIPVAEKNGTILKLGEMVFRKVCQFIASDEFKALGLDYIEVNLSVEQCSYEPLAKEFMSIMDHYGINPKRINLEITESAVVSAKETLLDNLETLQNEGVTFSLDDFGTGQSNLNYIVDMPVDVVKFDRGMIKAYFESEKARYVMNAAMGMIQGMGLRIVSEGVETKEQYDVMEDLNIDHVQGYYFSKPRPKEEFIEFIKENLK